MSIEVVKKYYEAFNNKNANAIVDLCDPDVANDLNQGDTQIGKKNLKIFLETAWAHFDEKVSNIIYMSNHDQTKIATEYLVQGVYYKTKPGLFEANNQNYEICPATIFTIKNGKIIRMTRYYNAKKWFEMVNPSAK